MKIEAATRLNPYTDSVMRVWMKEYVPAHVVVLYGKIEETAAAMAATEMKVPDWKLPGVFPEDNRAFVIHNFWLNTVNFAFSHFGGKYNKYQLPGSPMFVGAFACAAAFLRGSGFLYGKDGGGHLSATQMLGITSSLKKTKRFFRGGNGIPMAGERRANLDEAARTLLEDYRGEPRNILEEADWHAYEHGGKPGITDLLVRDFGPVFDDRETLALDSGETRELLFMKRAQLLPLMIHGRALGSRGELPAIRDIEKLGPVADYSVPNALRHLGILEYSPALTQTVDRRVEILAHSKAEIEIRMSTVAAMAELLAETNVLREKAGKLPITMAELDYAVWSLGRKAKYLHHLTRTTAY
ncbi:MAG: hypothetical protein HYT14_00920 [Candidatus Liptonbacteria bacterium]|nr:hypothetical protein [Candidatus Liptonbacteria bacterium]